MSRKEVLFLFYGCLNQRRGENEAREEEENIGKRLFSFSAVGDVMGVFWKQQTVDVSVQVCSHSNTGLEENN